MAVVLEAYFDESGRQGGVFCVAGYVFTAKRAKSFTRDWSALFSGVTCHMTDLANLKGAFADITSHERDRLLIEAVKIINKRVTYGVAVSCNTSELAKISPTWIRGFSNAYPFCCHMAMSAVGKWLRDSGSTAEVAYFFENNDEHEAEARVFMNYALKDLTARRSYGYYSDAFVPKNAVVPLQAADMLAWEWAKCRDETIDQGKREIRRSLRALFEGGGLNVRKRYKVLHLSGGSLEKFMTHVKGLGETQRTEDEIRSLIPRFFKGG